MAVARIALTALALLTAPCFAFAAPLDKDACEKLKAEQAGMAQAKDHLAKGPEWGKANLTADQLKAVQRYIEVEEQIAFRCVQRKVPEHVAKAPRAKAKAAKGQAESEGSEQEAPKQPVPRKKQAASTAGTGGEAAQKPAVGPARKSAPVAKPKTNDAYSPPAPKSSE